MSETSFKDVVRDRYGHAALTVLEGARPSCCGAGSSAAGGCDAVAGSLYDIEQVAAMPEESLLASLGCGNPTALAQLKPGETVLDLGCGGGLDVLLSARRVGSTGKAYGLDMTDEMLALAEKNRRKSGLANVEFLQGEIEDIPLPDSSVDVIISNCVINLSTDKERVFREAYRVLKPGGRFAVFDIVTEGPIPDDIRRSAELWAGCVAGALDRDVYLEKLRAAGFSGASIEKTRVYCAEDASDFLAEHSIDADRMASLVAGSFSSSFIRAHKPHH